ncbi:MAG: hypothetical protein KA500_00205 [Rhodoluna sp.]|nr:hypothetical protein [Rhodoluna sp.]MBP6186292.1 hypothetical protein [Rhodoluna sp.]
MPPWAWVLIWVGLSIASLAYFAWIAAGLMRQTKRLLRQLEPTIAQLVTLSEAMQPQADYQPSPNNLLDDPAEHVANYAKLRKAKADKAAKRQRRLINKLIDFKPEESEINNGRT